MLGRSLDELPPQTRRLLLLIDEMVSQQCERAEDRALRISLQPPRGAPVHGLGRHAVAACICSAWKRWNICWCIAAGAARASSTNCCTIDAEDGKPQLPGLIDVGELAAVQLRRNRAGSESQKSGLSRPQVERVSERRCAELPEPLVRFAENGSLRNPKTSLSGDVENRIVVVPTERQGSREPRR